MLPETPHAFPRQVFERGGLRDGDLQATGLTKNGPCQGVLRLSFSNCSELDNLRRFHTRTRQDLEYIGLAKSERAGFVQDDRIDRAERFHVSAAFDYRSS